VLTLLRDETLHKLDRDILILLLERDYRPSEIRRRLAPEYHYDDRIFDVVIARRLKHLKTQGLVKRTVINRQHVSYSITDKGRYRLLSDHNRIISERLPEDDIHIQALRFLMYVKILVVDIMTPYEAPPETYVENLRERINKDDLIEQLKALLNDPRKGYSEFSKYIERYEKKRHQIAIAKLNSEDLQIE
jgi:DNA-binding PadR family transcriptional regulator